MGHHFDKTDHCLKEFSKSLTDRKYKWYACLKLGTVRDWTHPLSLFNAKFFYAKARFTLAQLNRTRQHSDEDLDIYVIKFHENALHCWNPVSERCALASVCME